MVALSPIDPALLGILSIPFKIMFKLVTSVAVGYFVGTTAPASIAIGFGTLVAITVVEQVYLSNIIKS